ncbi:MAG: AhpC/TSA family protein [Planctomycetaceae bacterium]|nr:AhpC/TSA family protein [Planctomycetaceae bacterium]
MMRLLSVAACLLLISGWLTADDNSPAADGPPAMGDTVADFELPVLDGETVKLSELAKDGPVVVVVLRGFPGKQCPLCRAQAIGFGTSAKKFADAGAKVLMIYPGGVDDLTAKAKQFLGGQTVPDGFTLALDPGYTFTSAWNLRWDDENETAYPSTFIIGEDMTVQWAKVSMSHGGRSNPGEVLNALKGKE